MATNGSFITSAYNGKKWLEFYWERIGYDIGANTTTIKWTLTGRGTTTSYHKAAPFKVVIDGTQEYYSTTRIELYAGTVVASGTKTIKHNEDGTRSFSASVEAAIYTNAVNVSGSNSWTLDSLPRQATLTVAPNFNDEQNPTITYNNPAGNSVTKLQACISLTGAVDDIAYRDIPKTGSSYTFNLTAAERQVLINATKNSNTRTVIFFVATTIGGVIYHSTLQRTLTIANATPEITVSAKDVGAASTLLTGNANKIIKGFNYVLASMSSTLKKGATIKSQTITCGGQTLIGEAGGSASMEGGFNNLENNTIAFGLTDSRGNTVNKYITLEMINYVKLTCNISNNKPNTSGAMTVNCTGNYFNGSFGAVANTLTVQYRYKTQGGSYGNWIAMTVSKSGNTYTATASLTGLDYKKAYVFQTRAIDKINTGGVNSAEKTVKATPVFDWGENDFIFNVPVYGKLHNYSTEEQVLGTWIDGKPLYRTVVSTGSFASSYNLPIKNIDTLVNIDAMFARKDYPIYCKLPFRTNDSAWNTSLGNITIDSTFINIIVAWGTTISNAIDAVFKNFTIILEYTKTTD